MHGDIYCILLPLKTTLSWQNTVLTLCLQLEVTWKRNANYLFSHNLHYKFVTLPTCWLVGAYSATAWIFPPCGDSPGDPGHQGRRERYETYYEVASKGSDQHLVKRAGERRIQPLTDCVSNNHKALWLGTAGEELFLWSKEKASTISKDSSWYCCHSISPEKK